MKGISFKHLFKSRDSQYALRTAGLVTMVPLFMLFLIIFALWLLISLNHSYFLANGLVEQSKETFVLYLLQSQIDYLPYLGVFFIGVFFLGLYLSHIALRPFTQLAGMCENVLRHESRKMSYNGLDNKKLLVKTGYFLEHYSSCHKNKSQLVIPKAIMEAHGPTFDWIFYFQFVCVVGILTTITVFGISAFTGQLYDDMIRVAFTILKPHKGLERFLSSQESVINSIVLVPSLLSIAFYALIARLIISRIEGVTFAYVRDIRDMAAGKPGLRLRHRADDPGQVALHAVNRLLDYLHPEYATLAEAEVRVNTVLSNVHA